MFSRLARIGAAAALVAGVACHDPASSQESPLTFSIYPGQKYFGILLGNPSFLDPTLRNARGEKLPLPPGLALVSRNPAIVSVDSGTFLFARGLGTTWIVGTLPVQWQVLTDSVEVGVSMAVVR